MHCICIVAALLIPAKLFHNSCCNMLLNLLRLRLKSSIAEAALLGRKEIEEFLSHDSTHSKADFEEKLMSVYSNEEQHAALDTVMMSVTNSSQSKIISAIMPDGLLRPFPDNALQV
jgi:hypothetical protein